MQKDPHFLAIEYKPELGCVCTWCTYNELWPITLAASQAGYNIFVNDELQFNIYVISPLSELQGENLVDVNIAIEQMLAFKPAAPSDN